MADPVVTLRDLVAATDISRDPRVSDIAGLVEEAAELAAVEDPAKRLSEAGDVLWYVAAVSRDFGLPLSQVLYAATYAPATRQLYPVDAAVKVCAAAKRAARGDEGVHGRLADALADLACVAVGCAEAPIGDIVAALETKLRARKKAGTIMGDGEGVRA